MTPLSPPALDLPAGATIDPEGIWTQVLRPAPGRRRAALFLDRDGVVVEEVNYLHRVEDARLIDDAARVIRAANRRGVAIVLVTNQAGIGRGYYGWPEFMAVQARILADLAAAGALIDAVYACPHHGGGVPPYNVHDHPARKPNPGMLLRAAHALGLDLSTSWIVGDRASDLGAGRNAGIAGGIHVPSGHGNDPDERRMALSLAREGFRTLAADRVGDVLGLVPLLA